MALLLDQSFAKDQPVYDSKSLLRHLNILEGTNEKMSWIKKRLKKVFNISYHKHGEKIPDGDLFRNV